jgi:flagellar assembly protein FliH
MSVDVIPKERLTAFQRWEMDSFDRPPSAEAEPVLPEPISQEQVRLPTADEVENIHQEAHKAGYAAGYEEGTARARMEALRFHTLAEELEQALTQIDQSVADNLVSLAVELAEQMVRQSLAIKPDLVLGAIRETLQQIFHPHATVHLHPEDAALLRRFTEEQPSHAGHRIFEDATIARGGCRVEAGGCQIDATMQTRWRRIVENLGRSSEWTPEAPETAQDP